MTQNYMFTKNKANKPLTKVLEKDPSKYNKLIDEEDSEYGLHDLVADILMNTKYEYLDIVMASMPFLDDKAKEIARKMVLEARLRNERTKMNIPQTAEPVTDDIPVQQSKLAQKKQPTVKKPKSTSTSKTKKASTSKSKPVSPSKAKKVLTSKSKTVSSSKTKKASKRVK